MPAAGVFKKEVDLSLFTEVASDLVLGIVGPFSKGPINSRTLITNGSQLETTFGKPIDDDVLGQAFFAAREYFRNGNKAEVVRIDSALNPAVTGKTGLRGATDDNLATNTDGATSVPATRTLTSAGSTFDTAGVLVGDTLEVNTPGADDGFYTITVVAATVLTIDRDWPVGSLAAQTFTVWSSKLEGGVDGATSAPATRQFTSAGSTFLLNGVSVGDVLSIADVSTAEDDGFYTIAAVPGETTLLLNRDFPEGDLTTLTFTVYGRNHVDTADGDTTTDGMFVATTAQFLLHGVKAGDLLIIEDVSTPGDNGTYVIDSLESGSEDTTLNVNIQSWPTGALTGLTYRVVPAVVTLPGESPGAWSNTYTAKAVTNVTTPSQFDVEVRDAGGFLLETIFGMDQSNVVAQMLANSSTFPAVTLVAGRLGPTSEYTGTVNGGENGTTGITDADLIGTGSVGLQAFKNVEEVIVDVLLIPGYSQSQNVGDALVNMSEQTRGDCMCLLDPPDFPTVNSVQDVIDWSNGTGGFGRTSALNSSHAATYWTWQQIFDPFNDKDRFTTSSGHAVSVYAQSQNQTKEWFPPAGTRRGKVTGSSDVRFSPGQPDRNALQVGQNINPIVKFIKEGIHVFGQKTLLRSNSALNRVHVRRMLLSVERSVLDAAKTIVFEPGDDTTDREFIDQATPLLEFVQDNRGLREFLIVAVSTDADRAGNKVVYQIFIKPTPAAEIVEVQFVLTAQSANFSELLAA